MPSIDTLTHTAKDMGIRLTRANLGTEMYEAWAARVAMAMRARNAGNRAEQAEWVRKADAYAV